MRSWWRSRTGKILLYGGLCVLAQQIAVGYRIDFMERTSDASLIHLHAGLLLAVVLLEPDRRVAIGALVITALAWAVRQWGMTPGDGVALLWGAGAWIGVGLWTFACAEWTRWPRDPLRRRIDRHGLGRLALYALLIYPAGLALLGGTILLIEQPAVALSAIFQMFFAKHFGTAVVTLPLMVAWTERHRDAVRHRRGVGWGWLLVAVGGLGLSLWLSQRVAGALVGPAVLLMDYRFALFVVLAWLVLRLAPRFSMAALSVALFCLVYAMSGAAGYGNTAIGLFNLVHLMLEVDVLLMAMLYLWVISRDRRELAHKLSEETLRDTLTGLPNLRALRQRMRISPPQRGELGFLLLDQADRLLIGFGLDSQAAVMRSMAARLADLVDVHYLGTGQFGLVPRDGLHDDVWERLMARVEHAEFFADDQPVRLLPYLGVASLSPSASAADTVDAALLTASHLAFDARHHGEVRPRYSDLADNTLRHIHRQQLLDAAQALSCLRNERLVLHFQPIRRLEHADQPVLVISGEVLCRLRDDHGRLIPPARFMRPIEAAGRGAELDLAVIKALFRQLRRYPEALPYCERLAINLTGQSLTSMSFQVELRTLLADSPLPLSALCFEVTETAAISSTPMASRLLSDLRARGCEIAIDDFGTGMQSFSRLKELPVDIIKIDGSFVRNIARRGNDYALVRATVAIAEAFGAQTVAEFVENAETAACLGELGVDWVQGNFYARPRPLSEVLADTLPRELTVP